MPPVMPAAKLSPPRAEDNDHAAGHVFAAVGHPPFDHCLGPRVTHREAFARSAAAK